MPLFAFVRVVYASIGHSSDTGPYEHVGNRTDDDGVEKNELFKSHSYQQYAVRLM